MPPGVVIDLLSSDDQVTPEPNITAKRGNGFQNDFLLLPHDFDSTVDLDQEWGVSPNKRRRLSSPPKNDPLPTPSAGYTRKKQASLKEATPEVDPIVFTSSAYQTTSLTQNERHVKDIDSVVSIASDDSLQGDILQAHPRPSSLANLSSRTAALLATLNGPSTKNWKRDNAKNLSKGPRERGRLTSCNSATSATLSGKEEGTSRRSAPSKKKNTRLTEDERLARDKGKEVSKKIKARERELAKEQKAQDKEEDNERKRLLRAEMVREKQRANELAEANKSKLDKKDSTPEMVVDLPASLSDSGVDTQVREMLKNLGVEVTSYQSTIPNVIRWRRKTKAKWDPDLEHWEPIPQMVIINEKHVLCLMEAKDLVTHAMAAPGEETLEMHATKLTSAYAGCTPIYMIKGLDMLLRNKKTAENRAYRARVLGQDLATSSLQQKGKRKRAESIPPMDESVIEAALLKLQVVSGCFIHHTIKENDTAEWIATFTQHISTIPYRQQRMNLSTTFCMESGQVKTGENKDETFIKMLQEVVRVTPPIAHGISNAYSNVVKLVEAFRKRGPLVLEDLRKSANRNGALTDRKIGPAISRRLYRVFMERDPESTDV